MKKKNQRFRISFWVWAVLRVQLCGTFLSMICAGCATDGYIGNRAHDAGDVFTAGVGIGGGAKVRVGPVQTGILFDIPKAGLRGGRLSVYSEGKEEFISNNHDFQFVCFGVEGFSLTNDLRHKSFQAGATASGEFGETYIPFFHRVRMSDHRVNRSYYTDIQVVLAIGGSIRLGFNPGELLDFILGLFMIDIYDDDLTAHRSHTNGAQGVPH